MAATNPPVSTLGFCQFKAETAFADDTVDFAVAPTYLPVLGSVDVGGAIRMAWEDDTLRQTFVALPKLMGGARQTEFEFSFRFRPRGFSATVPTVAPTIHFPATLVAAAMGNRVVSTDDPATIGAIGTTAAFSVTDGELLAANNSFAGGFFGITTGAATAYNGRFMQDADEAPVAPLFDDWQIHAEHPVSAAPGTSDLIYAGITCYHIDTFDATNAPSYAFQWQGHASTDVMVLLGCRPVRFTYTITVGQIPEIEMTWRAAGYYSTGTSSLVQQAPSSPQPEIAADGFASVTDGTTTKSQKFRTAVFTYENELSPDPDINSTNQTGVADWVKVGNKATLSIDPLFDDQYETWHGAQTGLYSEISWGTQAGKLQGIQVPYGHIHEPTYAAERESLRTKPFVLAAGDYTQAATSDAHNGVTPGDANPLDKKCKVGWA